MIDQPDDAVQTPTIEKMITLPDALEQAINAVLQETSAARWIREAQVLSERYRAARRSGPDPLVSTRESALGYVAMILPASYAQLRGVMAATQARIPQWQPRTLLDLGSGPGTALWAAVEQWPSLTTLEAWERERVFIDLGRRLARGSRAAAIRDARWKQIDLRSMPLESEQRYDLVVLGHVLNELDPESRERIVDAAWKRTAGVLLIVEPGTSAAFPVVRAARDQLLIAGARTIAPCAHDQPCPLQNDWCHFPQRIKRPDAQRRARGAPSEWEDSKFSYAALARFAPASSMWGRVIREPTSNKAYAEALVSSRQGIVVARALKRHKTSFHLVRKLLWGAALAQPLPDPVETIERHPMADKDD